MSNAKRSPESADARPLLPEGTGLVVIGRNEGARLTRCLESIGAGSARCIYVDSGSTDASLEVARSLRFSVLELDGSDRFTAARARNAGARWLAERWPEVQFVQFLDGDCILDPGWLHAARQTLAADPSLGLVTGVLREVGRDRSLYNRLCDMEWDGPLGEIQACGGIAMLRMDAFWQAGGMNPNLLAGEEADLHLRMRRGGWKLKRIPQSMALHDAELLHFRQWWKRNVRAGHACAEGARTHGSGSERYNVREARSNWSWGLLLPVAALGLVPVTRGLSFLMIPGGFGLLYARIFSREKRRGRAMADAELYARFTTIGKIPQALGQVLFHLSRRVPGTGREYSYEKEAPER